MEHSLLTGFSLPARENVLHTYLDLARALPGTTVVNRPGYQRIEGNWPLSFCHFAGDFHSSRDPMDIARELRAESRHGDGLWVFLLPGDEPAGLSAAFLESGFAMRQCLCQMGTLASGSMDLELREASDPDERIEIGQFMAGQFFPYAGDGSRQLVARSTAASLARLLYTGDLKNPEAAMMISRSPGTAGLYNLCVAPELRGLGLGSRLVRAASGLAHRTGVPLTLQCHGTLRKWYEKLGFEFAGTFHAFFSSGSPKTDII